MVNMDKLHIASSPMNNRIYAGFLASADAFRESKKDVTGVACAAVCEFVLASDGIVVVTANDAPKYEISVKKL